MTTVLVKHMEAAELPDVLLLPNVDGDYAYVNSSLIILWIYSITFLELHRDDAWLFGSTFKGVSAYLRSKEWNSHDSTEKWDAKNFQERSQGILVLLTNLLTYLAG